MIGKEIRRLVVCKRNAKDGVTLAEILIGISMVALMASMGLLSAKLYKDRAKQIKCLSQIRGIGNALQVYGAEHEGFLPSLTENNVEIADVEGTGALDIRFELYRYDPTLWSITCPSDFRNRNNPDPFNPSYISYNYHPKYGLNLEQCTIPLPLVSDAFYFHGRPGSWKKSVVYSDNHVEVVPW